MTPARPTRRKPYDRYADRPADPGIGRHDLRSSSDLFKMGGALTYADYGNANIANTSLGEPPGGPGNAVRTVYDKPDNLSSR